MRRFWLFTLFVLAALPALAQETGSEADATQGPNGTITIASKGRDVRNVLHDIFLLAGKDFVIRRLPRTELFLALSGVEFEEALTIVCDVAGLEFEVQNGIYYVQEVSSAERPVGTPTEAKPPVSPPKPAGKLDPAVLDKRITTRFTKTDFRKIVAEIAKQTELKIEVAEDVPNYLMNAFLIDTSLKYGLDLLTGAANLQYVFTENKTIRIQPKKDDVAVVDH